MKSIFIITAFFACFFAKAEPLANKAPALSVEKPAQEVKIANDPLVLINQQAYSDRAKRNGFNTFYVAPAYSIKGNELVLLLQSGFGEVIQETAFFPKGTMEVEGMVSAYFSNKEAFMSIAFSTEFNFTANDGINKMVAGLDIPFSFILPDFSAISLMGVNIGVGIFLKAFISKHFALIPRLGVSYERSVETTRFFPWLITTRRVNDFNIHLSLGLRRYF